MTRPLRLHVPGGFYHVTLRGNHRQDIFRTPADRETLNDIVAGAIRELGVRVHAFCWMTNHIHVLAQVSDVPLGRVVLRIASRYARLFQKRLDTTGHLFERRYHAVLVDAEAYLLALVRYIHLNPVRAGLVDDPGKYAWSSHGEYLGGWRRDWVHTGFALDLLASDRRDALQRYVDWMNAGCETRWGEGALVTNAANPQVLGNDDFLKRVSASQPQCRASGTLDELLAECARRFEIAPEAIVSRSRARYLSPARAWLAHEAVSRGVASVSSVARLLGRSEAAIRGLIARYPSPK